MSLVIEGAEAVELAEELARRKGVPISEAILQALRNEVLLARLKVGMKQRLADVVASYQALPVLDNRSADEILGYDENGLPT